MNEDVQQGGDSFGYDNFNQQAQAQGQMPFMMGKRFDPDFTRWQYDTTDILADIENFLRGRVRNEDGDFVQVYQPLADQEGINLLMGDLRFKLNKGVFLSNLSKDDVLRIGLETRKMIIRWLYLNWKKYNIQDANLDRIVYSLDHSIYCALMKPLDDKERKHLGENNSRQEQVLITNEQNKKRWGIF